MKVLHVTQEMEPYTSLTKISEIFKDIPKHTNENGCEIRVLMPKYGVINERRHRLHEVVRLSGMNIIVDDEDYPLIIKVASIPSVRIQVYFLDNEEFFKRKFLFHDEQGVDFEDNVERMVFFCKGVMETVRKFGWQPDIIHCHGSITSLIPLFAKRVYQNDPIFSESKVLYSAYTDELSSAFSKRFYEVSAINDLNEEDMKPYFSNNHVDVNLGAMHYSDAIISGTPEINELVVRIAQSSDKPYLPYHESPEHLEAILNFYKEQLKSE
jgi:starch synthase